MAQKLTKQEVKKIADLARVALTDQEIEKFSNELSDILEYVHQLQEVDTASVRATNQVTGLSNVLRDDVVDACSDPEKLIALAPEHEDNLVKVKEVFDNGS